MVNYMDKKRIIELKEEGLSNREVARRTGHGRGTVSKYWNEYRERLRRLDEPGADVREIQYELGGRLEYDFGEVFLDCGENPCGGNGIKTYHMAVLSSPGGGFRWLYLYTNQKKAVFIDSHVKFFEMMGGSYREIVYDNMRNAVSKFIGKNEKELNESLVKMSLYSGFRINVANCFKDNEKGHVESSVKDTAQLDIRGYMDV